MIAAFDPGVTTGVAIWRGADHEEPFHAGQLDEEGLDVWLECNAADITHAQIEQFVITDATIRKARVYESLYVIGVLRFYARRYGWQVGWTKPSDVMAPFPDAALKRAKMHTPGKGHANDAARHLAYHLVRTKTLSGAIFLER